jgi:hypothetical protein
MLQWLQQLSARILRTLITVQLGTAALVAPVCPAASARLREKKTNDGATMMARQHSPQK